MLTLCIPTLSRYDLLYKCIKSAAEGTVKPDLIYIVDNGKGFVPENVGVKTIIHIPPENMGVAASWNYLIKMTTGRRLIVNDDIVFHPDTIEKMMGAMDDGNDFVWNITGSNGFSCFLLNQHVVDTVGGFDEMISPNYAYFEDNDYHMRMKLKGVVPAYAGTSVDHLGSATLKAMSNQEISKHHVKFELARENYIKKWGGLPGEEMYKTPFNT
jgi:GT2 family glycosyltransferase